MKHIRAMLVTTGLFVVAGAMGTARAQDGISLYTGAIEATHFACNAVNVSSKPLKITISVIDMDGHAVQKLRVTSAHHPTPTMPTRTASSKCMVRAIAVTSGPF